MMTVLFLFYFIVGLQIVFKPNRFIKLQFLLCLFLTMLFFNYHSHLVQI
ncbi:Uncharacterised protein [Legionella lansingensis]|nr:DUF5993 family protein [Legionella lansingensis]SNV46175.1 Uncharacterised protein [Legionella lansingensis]